MKWSKKLIHTLKEQPKNVENISHSLSIRAGLVRPLISGVYSYLPLGWRVISNIITIIKKEMNRIGGQELFLPALTPSELWEETGRWEEYGKEMFKLKDRRNRDMCLAPTHEEIMTEIARKEITSYKNLPQIWYQIQTKFRDEIRPRGGLFRLRQFIMKDSYSFDINDEMFKKSYDLHREAYNNIFKRCGLDFITVKASSGLMGGSLSEEFMVFSESGEDVVVVCEKCGYKANREVAKAGESSKFKVQSSKDEPLTKVYTPVKGSVEEVSKFLKVPKTKLMKSLLYIIDEEPVFLLLDGEHELSDEKIRKLGTARAATPDEIKTIAGASPGYIGPIGLKTKVKKFADTFLKSQRGLITGANEDMYHLKGVNLERDLKIDEYVDLMLVNDGDKCENCGDSLKVKRTIEIGHIFNLGTKYSSSMGAFFLNKNGERRPIVMGSYGTSPERIMMSIIETHHDEDGIIWPLEIAPYKVLIIPLNIENPEIKDTAETIWSDLNEKTETLIDDRNESVGVKFKDALLIGIPLQIIIGERSLKTGKVEIKSRDGKFSKVVKKEDASKEVIKIVNRE